MGDAARYFTLGGRVCQPGASDHRVGSIGTGRGGWATVMTE